MSTMTPIMIPPHVAMIPVTAHLAGTGTPAPAVVPMGTAHLGECWPSILYPLALIAVGTLIAWRRRQAGIATYLLCGFGGLGCLTVLGATIH